MWSRDGKELFFVPAPGRFMAVTVRTAPSFTFTSPVAVPRGFVAGPSCESADIRHHARRPDRGRRDTGPEPKRIRAGADSRRAELVRGAEAPRADEVTEAAVTPTISGREYETTSTRSGTSGHGTPTR